MVYGAAGNRSQEGGVISRDGVQHGSHGRECAMCSGYSWE